MTRHGGAEKRGGRQLVAAAMMRSMSSRGTGSGRKRSTSAAVAMMLATRSLTTSVDYRPESSARKRVALVERRVVEHALEQRAAAPRR